MNYGIQSGGARDPLTARRVGDGVGARPICQPDAPKGSTPLPSLAFPQAFGASARMAVHSGQRLWIATEVGLGHCPAESATRAMEKMPHRRDVQVLHNPSRAGVGLGLPTSIWKLCPQFRRVSWVESVPPGCRVPNSIPTSHRSCLGWGPVDHIDYMVKGCLNGSSNGLHRASRDKSTDDQPHTRN